MLRLFLVLAFLGALPVHAGFRMFSKDGQYIESTDPAPAEQEAKIYEYQGKGDSAHQIFVAAGAYKALVTHDGREQCRMEARQLSGQEDLLLSDFLGNGFNERVLTFAKGGKYTLNVHADGGWSLKLVPVAMAATDQGQQASATPDDASPERVHATPSKARDVDMTGVEWRQSRGIVSGRNTESQTVKYGYESGRYQITATSNSNARFTVWIFSRRGMKKQLFDAVKIREFRTYLDLPEKDEIWFSVRADANWEIIVERAR